MENKIHSMKYKQIQKDINLCISNVNNVKKTLKKLNVLYVINQMVY